MPFLITEHSMDWFEGNGYSWAKDIKALAFTKTFANVVDYYFGNPYCLGGFAWSMFDYNNEVNYTRTENAFLFLPLPERCVRVTDCLYCKLPGGK